MATRTITSRIYQAGEQILNFQAGVTGRYTRATVSLQRENWPDVPDLVVARIERLPTGLPDLPQNWREEASATFAGGDVTTDAGPLTHSTLSVASTNPDGTPAPFDGAMRLRVTNTQAIRTTVTVEGEEAP